MTIDEAFSLINTGIIFKYKKPGQWADLGCGSGIFTLALGKMLPEKSTIYAIDRQSGLQSGLMDNGVEIAAKEHDFVNDDLRLENLDGVLMANSLHYVKDKPLLIKKIEKAMKPGGHFLIVEYDTDSPVAKWVPYPVSFRSLVKLFNGAGYSAIQKLGERPSVYGHANMYAALIGK